MPDSITFSSMASNHLRAYTVKQRKVAAVCYEPVVIGYRALDFLTVIGSGQLDRQFARARGGGLGDLDGVGVICSVHSPGIKRKSSRHSALAFFTKMALALVG